MEQHHHPISCVRIKGTAGNGKENTSNFVMEFCKTDIVVCFAS